VIVAARLTARESDKRAAGLSTPPPAMRHFISRDL
jgi:hypothetical protein